MVAILKDRIAASDQETDAGCLRELLQTIFRATASAGDRTLMRFGRGRSEQILLDAGFDGDRYLLIRIPLAPPPRLSLSPREQEIVRMIAQGHSNKRIAVLLNLSLWTIGTHVRRIFAKLGVSSRAAMVARLMEAGDLALNARPAAVQAAHNGTTFTAGFTRPQTQPEVVATLAVFPASQNRPGGARLGSTATNGGAVYRNWTGERDRKRLIGKPVPRKRERLQ
jgi:DNA-binding CsgD family transcriptional regulator